MAEKKLNFDAPLLSTSRMKKEAVSVRRNMRNKLTDDVSKTSESLSVPILVQDMGLNQVPESTSVPLECLLEKPVDENLIRLQSSNVEEEEESEEDDDDVFSDALDTLSLKHSINGNVEATKPIMPSEDPQSRDFMLNRFLRAAKSMTVEQQPRYAFKRQPSPVTSEPMRQIRDIVSAKNHATPKRYEFSITPSYYQYIYDDESKHDDDDNDDDDNDDDDGDEVSEYLYRRSCGMSPQLCFKNSLGMLISVNGLKEKPYSLRTSSHYQVKSCKMNQLKSRFQAVKKIALDSIHKQKLVSRAQSPLHSSVGKKFNFGSESNLTTGSMPPSPYRKTGCMSRSVANSSLHHPAGFLGTRKEEEIMRANRLNNHIRNTCKSQDLLYPKTKRVDCSTSSVMEMRLYADTEYSPKTSNDQGNSKVKILPETMEKISDEVEAAGNKPKLQAVGTLNNSSGIKKMEADELEKNNNGCDLFLLALPSPKKPSDSWLFRNLASVSSKIYSSRRYLFHPQEKDLKDNSTSVTKWETIVKTSYMHRDHICYSEELFSRSSFQS